MTGRDNGTFGEGLQASTERGDFFTSDRVKPALCLHLDWGVFEYPNATTSLGLYINTAVALNLVNVQKAAMEKQLFDKNSKLLASIANNLEGTYSIRSMFSDF
jgi:hypothetical protein